MKFGMRHANSRSRVSKMVLCCFMFLILPGLAPHAFAAPHVVGSLAVTGLPHATFVSGNRVYVANHAGGVKIVNVKDPKHPRSVGVIDTQNAAVTSVFVSGNFAYVTNSHNGFKIFNIANPKSPVRVGLLGTDLSPFRADDVFVKGKFAYIAASVDSGGRTRGLHVVDIEDPTKPSVTGSVATPVGADVVVVSGAYAFVGGSESGISGTGHLWVVALSDPKNPEIVGSMDTTGKIADIAVAGHYLHIVEESGVLQIVDVNDPQNPAPVGSLPDLLNPRSVAVMGKYAYLADTRGFHTVDISDPTAPRIAHTLNINSPEGVSASGKYAYIINYPSPSLNVVEVSDLRNPRLSGSLEIPGYAEDVFVTGNYAHVAAGNEGLQLVDVKKPNQPALAGSLKTPDFAMDVQVSGSYACLLDDQNVHVVNVANPSNPSIVQSIPTFGYVDKAFIQGSYAYLIGTDWGLGVADISDPANPVVVGNVAVPGGSLWDLSVSGSHAYVATFEGLFVADVSVPQAPTIAAQFKKTPYLLGVAAVGDQAYLTDGLNFLVVDAKDPNNLSTVGTVQESTQHICASGGYVYAAANKELKVIDVSEAARPVVVGSLGVEIFINSLHVSGNYAYLVGLTSDWESLLLVVDISDYTMKEKGIVSGALQVDGAPLAGIQVKLYQQAGTKWIARATRTTNKSGTYTFQELLEGDYYLDLLNIPAANLVEGDITVEGSPFASRGVKLYAKTGTTWVKKADKKTNAAGAFKFTGLSAGTYRLKAMNLKLLGKPML